MLSLMFPAPHDRTDEIEPSPLVLLTGEARKLQQGLFQTCGYDRNLWSHWPEKSPLKMVMLRCDFSKYWFRLAQLGGPGPIGTSKIVSKGICAEIYAANLWWTCARCASVSLWAFAFLSCTRQKTHLQRDFTFFIVFSCPPFLDQNESTIRISQLSFHCHDLKLKPWQRKRFLLDL